ncbi:HugZ family protein [Pseudomonas aeruginosa]
MSVEAAKNARELLLKEYRAVLSTHSKKWPGFPFGSVVPYCLDAEGRPLILISRIAQHTHNLQADPRCSMLVGERGAEDIQAVGRLTLLAEARQLAEEEVAAAAERYYRYFPESVDYHRVHDFDFWVLQPVQWRFIGGFGAIHWLAAERVPLANPFAGEAERGMVEHMNSDHAAAIAHYVELAGLPAHAAAQLAGIDTEGFHLRIGQGLHWLPFPAACGNPGAVRQALVQLARAERWPTVEPEQG